MTLDIVKIVEKETFSPEQINYGVRFSKNKGNSTVTEVFINSDSIVGEKVEFRIYGTIEREGLADIFESLAKSIRENLTV